MSERNERPGTSLGAMLLYALLYNVVLLAGVGIAALTPWFTETAAGIIGFLLGAAVGSCLHQAWFRVRSGAALFGRASYCPVCQAEIPRRHNIPIWSWVVLRGKCFRCGAKIPWHYVAVEGMAGVVGCVMGIVFVRMVVL